MIWTEAQEKGLTLHTYHHLCSSFCQVWNIHLWKIFKWQLRTSMWLDWHMTWPQSKFNLRTSQKAILDSHGYGSSVYLSNSKINHFCFSEFLDNQLININTSCSYPQLEGLKHIFLLLSVSSVSSDCHDNREWQTSSHIITSKMANSSPAIFDNRRPQDVGGEEGALTPQGAPVWPVILHLLYLEHLVDS